MLSIINHEGNANQNHSEMLPHTSQNGCYGKDKKLTSVGEGEEKREASCTIGGNVNWCSHYEKQYGGFSKN